MPTISHASPRVTGRAILFADSARDEADKFARRAQPTKASRSLTLAEYGHVICDLSGVIDYTGTAAKALGECAFAAFRDHGRTGGEDLQAAFGQAARRAESAAEIAADAYRACKLAAGDPAGRRSPLRRTSASALDDAAEFADFMKQPLVRDGSVDIRALHHLAVAVCEMVSSCESVSSHLAILVDGSFSSLLRPRRRESRRACEPLIDALRTLRLARAPLAVACTVLRDVTGSDE